MNDTELVLEMKTRRFSVYSELGPCIIVLFYNSGNLLQTPKLLEVYST